MILGQKVLCLLFYCSAKHLVNLKPFKKNTQEETNFRKFSIVNYYNLEIVDNKILVCGINTSLTNTNELQFIVLVIGQ